MNLDVAMALRKSRGAWLLPDVFADETGLDAPGLREALRGLREAGFRIEVRPGGAMRLLAAPDRLGADEIAHRLDTRVIGRRVTVCAETASTNDLARERLLGGAPEGECVLAEHQTIGRGRQGRRWIAPPRTAVLMSVGLRPPLDAAQGSALTFAASVAVAEAITAAAGVACAIEWPNDITCRDRKVAGILVEGGHVRPEALDRPARAAFVIGVGINANVPLAALPPEIRATATSLAEECGRPVDRVLLARHVLRALDTWYAVLTVKGLPPVLAHGHTDGSSVPRQLAPKAASPAPVGEPLRGVQARWLELSATVGRRLCIVEHGRRFEGVVVHVSPTEGLALRLDEGQVRLFRADSASVISRSARV